MTNNLIFANGAILAICPNDAVNAPRMTTSGWRSWHIEADNATSVEALESGIVSREYASIIGYDENDEAITEKYNEDLTEFCIYGSVTDHRDGTCTIWARCKTELEKTQEINLEYVENLKALGVEV